MICFNSIFAAKPHFDQETREFGNRWRVFKMSGQSVNFRSLSGPSAVILTPQIGRDTSGHELFGNHTFWNRHPGGFGVAFLQGFPTVFA